MTRTRSIKFAALLLVFLSILNILSTVQNVLDWISYFTITYNILGLVAAVGLWRGLRWGNVLALVVAALAVIDLSRGIFDSQLESFARVIGASFVFLYILVAVIALRNRPKELAA